MTEKTFHPDYARTIAQAICYDLSDFVEKIEIVGGLRRGQERVRGASVIYVSKVELIYPKNEQTSLFSDIKSSHPPKKTYLVDDAIDKLDYLQDRLDSDGRPVTPTRHPLHMRAMIGSKSPVPIDLYPVPSADEWGVALAVKTGPTKFLLTMMEKLKSLNIRCENETKLIDMKTLLPIPVPTEEEFFKICGMEWIQPNER